eukprot:TRINITY_DN16328_c0_g1_i1.p1 TRINITY_DN16328_c0_g1~~TRINITY_DN16328_c0_g1_i1.p1  ORF type:complete len:365 (+),score=69.86 TRINITY_DN16328_c0_g1_i1:363-1457(+)
MLGPLMQKVGYFELLEHGHDIRLLFHMQLCETCSDMPATISFLTGCLSQLQHGSYHYYEPLLILCLSWLSESHSIAARDHHRKNELQSSQHHLQCCRNYFVQMLTVLDLCVADSKFTLEALRTQRKMLNAALESDALEMIKSELPKENVTRPGTKSTSSKIVMVAVAEAAEGAEAAGAAGAAAPTAMTTAATTVTTAAMATTLEKAALKQQVLSNLRDLDMQIASMAWASEPDAAVHQLSSSVRLILKQASGEGPSKADLADSEQRLVTIRDHLGNSSLRVKVRYYIECIRFAMAKISALSAQMNRGNTWLLRISFLITTVHCKVHQILKIARQLNWSWQISELSDILEQTCMDRLLPDTECRE